MTTETQEQATTDEQQAAADLSAGFAAGFNDEEIKPVAPEKLEAAVETEEVKPEAAQETAPTQQAITDTELAELRASAARVKEIETRLRNADGRIGALNDQLIQLRKAKETDGKPAVLTPVELKRMKEQYPELSDALGGDIAEALAALKQPAQFDPEMLTSEARKLVAVEMAELRKQAVAEQHPTWVEDLWGPQHNERTPEYRAWLATMSTDEGQKFENSENPYFVRTKLAEFYAWRDKTTKTKQESKERLAAAVTPQGVPRTAGKPTVSDREAFRKGLAEGFNS